jgi:hypothetical protein
MPPGQPEHRAGQQRGGDQQGDSVGLRLYGRKVATAPAGKGAAENLSANVRLRVCHL